MAKVQCSDCGSPCKLEYPGKEVPEVCPFADEEGAHFATWSEVVDRRRPRKAPKE